jgi:transcriptional regulator with XRE-family HTH domain
MARRDAGFRRQQDLADLVSSGRSATISGWENDHAVPDLASLVKLIEALDVEPLWLITGRGPMRREPPGDVERRYRMIQAIARGDDLDAIDRLLDELGGEDAPD